MTNYKRGYNFEIRVRNKFRDLGFYAERKAASSPYDIIVMKDGRVEFVIDSKKTGQRDKDYIYITRENVEKMVNEADKIGAQPLIIFGFYRTPIYVELPQDLLKEDGKTIRLEKSLKLTNFLEKYKENRTRN